jgi:hypothetical protein
MEGASSRGAVATAIVRFDTVAKVRGDAFTITNTANDGTFITMRKAGKLNISASLTANISTTYLSLNQSVLTAVPSAAAQIIAAQSIDSNGNLCSLSSELDVNEGDVIRVACSQTPSANVGNSLNLSFQEQDISVSVTNTLPQFSESDSNVRLSGANGFGSTATAIRRFSSVVQNLGTDIEYVDSATLGAQFIAKSAGIYNVSYSEVSTANVAVVAVGINVNAVLVNVDYNRLNSATTSGKAASASWTGFLSQGDIVTADSLSTNLDGNFTAFSISKVGKPNVTGVDVTPFVNVPQPVSQFSQAPETTTPLGAGTAILNSFAVESGSGLYSRNTATGVFTALKRIKVSLGISLRSSSASRAQATVYVRGLLSALDITEGVSSTVASASWSGIVNPGEQFYLANTGAGATNLTFGYVMAEALSDQILTAPETFSTDTASLTYAPSSLYTLSTLNTAPVGTFITWTYAINSNTITQTTVAPTQTTADMNTNGIRLFTRPYNAASTAGNPARIQIQIGKGLKGTSLELYKSTGKDIAGATTTTYVEGAIQYGPRMTSYNATTGILTLDAAYNATNITTHLFEFNDLSNQNNGYFVINASKSPALTSVPLLQPRIATISDVKVASTPGGSSISGNQTRTLNTISDPTGIVTSLASNQFVLSAGTYYIEANVPGYACNQHQAFIRNITDSVNVLLGIHTRTAPTDSVTTFSYLAGHVTINSSKTFELQHFTATATATNGLGIQGNSGQNEVYSVVKIQKVK